MPRQRYLTRRHARGVLTALLIVPLLAWTGHAIGLASLTLSNPVTVGSSGKGTVTIDALPVKGSVTVQLSHNAPQVVDMPTSVSFTSLTNQPSKTFSIQTLATGCADVVASLSGETKRATLQVQPAANPSGAPSLSFSRNPTVSGGSLTGTVGIIAPAAGAYTVSLASTNPAAASVPTSVTVTATAQEGVFAGSASFPITTPVNNGGTVCPVISATRSGITGRKLLVLLPLPG